MKIRNVSLKEMNLLLEDEDDDNSEELDSIFTNINRRIMKGPDWAYELFDCYAAPLTCYWSCLVPCGTPCLQATITKLINDEKENAPLIAFLTACGLCCFGVAYNRTKLRKVYNIKGSYLNDCILATFCCCSMVREWREVMASKGYKEDEPVWKAWKGALLSN